MQGNPLLVKLASAAAIVVFALWGLGPLVRQSRNIFLDVSPFTFHFVVIDINFIKDASLSYLTMLHHNVSRRATVVGKRVAHILLLHHTFNLCCCG